MTFFLNVSLYLKHIELLFACCSVDKAYNLFANNYVQCAVKGNDCYGKVLKLIISILSLLLRCFLKGYIDY